MIARNCSSEFSEQILLYSNFYTCCGEFMGHGDPIDLKLIMSRFFSHYEIKHLLKPFSAEVAGSHFIKWLCHTIHNIFFDMNTFYRTERKFAKYDCEYGVGYK